MKSIHKNIQERRSQINKIFDNLNEKKNYFSTYTNNIVNNYIHYGDKKYSLTQISLMIQEDIFYKKYTDFPKDSYWMKKTNYEDMKIKFLKLYLLENKNDIKKIIAEIPWSLKPKIDVLIKELVYEENMNNLD
ncbi:Hypothetical protein KVN_LOCUS80 [uncultured virus]|nr:Hypothetical protein KVN_LOCUS80 [uncultured virus]